MYQQEIKFFWPLTEQIRLDLDYTPCEEFYRQKNTISSTGITSGSYLASTSGDVSWATTVTTNKIDTSEFVFRPKTENVGKWEITDNMFVYRPTKPNVIIRFFAKKLLGFKWYDEV
jgi:hypothetical protein